MAYKQNQEHSSYMDGVKVKISERYKPPPKISLPTSYSQRIELNKHIRDSIPTYDFSLENTVKEKMKEWREARFTITNERKERLEKLKEAKAKEKEEKTKREEEYKNFDPDTSSPFDNMALKTINDMAELALVLQNEEKIIPTTSTQGYSYNNPATYTQTYNTNYDNTQSYLYQPSTSSNSYNFPTNSNNTYNTTTTTSTSNGLLKYYDNLNPTYSQFYPAKDYLKTIDNNLKITKVPDIMKALQTELDHNKQLNVNYVIASSHKSVEKQSILSEKVENNECYRSLPANLQKMAKDVCSMGFPLDRVARVCKLIGDDHKKIVEHLLALSDLLDLGFPEPDVSSALFQCDNDRDKALDRLIS